MSLLLSESECKGKNEGRVTVNHYSDNMWGADAFETVLKQSEDGREQIKHMNKMLEDLSALWDSYSKKLQTCLTQTKPFIQSTNCEQLCWTQLRSLTETQCNAYRTCATEVKDISTALKIMKGELRNITRLLQRKKNELANEVQFATKNVEQCNDERTQCLKLYRNAQSAWKQSVQQTSAEDVLRPLLAQVQETEYHYRRSEEKWETSKQLLKAVSKKEDLCNGVMLDTFRTKEMERQCQVIKVIAQIIEMLCMAIVKIHKSNEQLFASANEIQCDDEMDKFILTCFKKTLITKGKMDLAAYVQQEGLKWNEKSVQMTWSYNERGINAIKQLIDFFTVRHAVEEEVSKLYLKKKHEWEGNLLTNPFGFRLNDVLQGLVDMATSSLSTVTSDWCGRIHGDIEPLLNDVRQTLKEFHFTSQNVVSECSTEFNHLETSLNKSNYEVNKLKGIVTALENKLHQRNEKKKKKNTQSNDGNEPEKRKTKFKLFKKSTEQLRKDLQANNERLSVEEQNRDKLQVQLTQKLHDKDALQAKVVVDFIRHERYRIHAIQIILFRYVFSTESQCLAIDRFLQSYRNHVKQFHVDNNITLFIEQCRSLVKAPVVVLEHTKFKIEESAKEDTASSVQELDVTNLKILKKFAQSRIRKRIMEGISTTTITTTFPSLHLYNNQSLQDRATKFILTRLQQRPSRNTSSLHRPYFLPQSQSQSPVMYSAEDNDENKFDERQKKDNLPMQNTPKESQTNLDKFPERFIPPSDSKHGVDIDFDTSLIESKGDNKQ
ncbi:hypothetical protein RFI_27059 [Reticulomyxa filosa]|uniref:Uncharacterized protein n=1 Tax=Reticulomyxa filosa TaxID=46433 RepID=X6MBB2_RETFI|nr:hypothetical protein RFI_27059 [Reticulomyxa filosa]|eukprot:ETO10320.1 hypothetical protein RFI_27059 [Reticulomyxa filosa]